MKKEKNTANILMKDIRKALKLLEENSKPLTTKKFYFGELTTNSIGTPIKFKLKKKYFKILQRMPDLVFRPTFSSKSKINTIYGLEVVGE